MAKSSAQAQAEKPEAQKGGATKMPIFATKFDGSGLLSSAPPHSA